MSTRDKRYDWNRKKYLRLMRKCFSDQLLYCIYCGKGPLYVGKSKGRPKNKRLTIDHFTPVSLSIVDDHDMTNFVIACSECNNDKGALSREELEGWVRKKCQERRMALQDCF